MTAAGINGTVDESKGKAVVTSHLPLVWQHGHFVKNVSQLLIQVNMQLRGHHWWPLRGVHNSHMVLTEFNAFSKCPKASNLMTNLTFHNF